MDLKEETVLGKDIDTHWYYLSKALALSSCLPHGGSNKILDVGAGSGFFSRWLMAHGLAAEATCVDTGYVSDRDEEINGRPLRFRRAIDASDANVVLLMDVLEHVEDDAGLLSSYLNKAEPQARAIITVPAFQFLWSPHDVFLEHFRRYTLKTLSDTLAKAGAEPIRMHYYYGAIFPLVVLLRLLNRNRTAGSSDLRREPRLVNSALRALCALERPVMKANRLAGLTAFCICRRKH